MWFARLSQKYFIPLYLLAQRLVCWSATGNWCRSTSVTDKTFYINSRIQIGYFTTTVIKVTNTPRASLGKILAALPPLKELESPSKWLSCTSGGGVSINCVYYTIFSKVLCLSFVTYANNLWKLLILVTRSLFVYTQWFLQSYAIVEDTGIQVLLKFQIKLKTNLRLAFVTKLFDYKIWNF